ncbi:NADH-quinone oxidoreductase subunit L [Actomonas aquatica]|uniref:NADH-quinone oxidoreductase subunit L n=1 Tax=Actomonas aquatica TaxID=2866162 RepID=A0ABZ1CBS3_9BACT|nr:NADH-quinone oxidoreductase subunit L [Opitutus sp. WL0086]WRQ88762.1 NADH-quinone oxidoreductase subunit L [Opitutus sp. WL0086]
MTLPVSLLWLIPALPLLAAGITALLPATARRAGSSLAIGALGLSFILSVGALLTALQDPAAHSVSNFAWFDLGDGALRLGWLLDPLTAFMAVMVTFVGTLIFIFASGYMADDARYKQFFCFLSLFAAAMLGLIVANSLLLLFISWEVVGLASYLLIGFWFTKPEAAAAAKKAFITTRIGDLGFLLGLVWLYDAGGSLLLYDGGTGVLEPATLAHLSTTFVCGGLAASTAIGLLLFCGAVGKSGQFPLHVWLPDAMEGPTPVSALIHAATMVAAGVFLIARIFPLMAADQGLAEVPVRALTVVAYIGAITALLGACIAVAQNDLKRVLAFSTVSQLGYMMLAIGVGSWVAAIFHLLTHAFFKALLFLGAGSVIHGMHHEQDMRFMGGLSKKMKTTFRTFAVGMMALAGVPFLFSGFWSKEAILHAAHEWDVSHLPLVFGLIAVVLTAFYMTRLMAETFSGHGRSSHAEHAHESPASMTLPLVILAVCAVLLGFLGTPAWPWLQSMLLGQHEVHGHSIFAGAGLMVLSIVLVAFGIGAGWFIYGRSPRRYAQDADPLQAKAPGLFAALAARLGFDELYAATAFRLNDAVATAADFADRWVWGGVIKALGGLGRLIGLTNLESDEEIINRGFDGTSRSLRESGESYSRVQTGDAHGYLLTIALSFVVLATLLLIGGLR